MSQHSTHVWWHSGGFFFWICTYSARIYKSIALVQLQPSITRPKTMCSLRKKILCRFFCFFFLSIFTDSYFRNNSWFQIMFFCVLLIECKSRAEHKKCIQSLCNNQVFEARKLNIMCNFYVFNLQRKLQFWAVKVTSDIGKNYHEFFSFHSSFQGCSSTFFLRLNL